MRLLVAPKYRYDAIGRCVKKRRVWSPRQRYCGIAAVKWICDWEACWISRHDRLEVGLVTRTQSLLRSLAEAFVASVTDTTRPSRPSAVQPPRRRPDRGRSGAAVDWPSASAWTTASDLGLLWKIWHTRSTGRWLWTTGYLPTTKAR